MLNKNNIIIWVVAILIIAFLTYAFLVKRVNWLETYDDLSTEPYGTFVFKKLLQTQNEGYSFKELNKSKTVYLESFKDSTDQNYIFLGGGFWIDSLHADQLFNFIKNGNNAVICSYIFSDEIDKRLARLDTVNYSEPYIDGDSNKNKKPLVEINPASLVTNYENYLDSISLHLIHPDFKNTDSSRIISYRNDGASVQRFFPAYYIQNFKKKEDVTPLGTFKSKDEKVDRHLGSVSGINTFNFIKVKIGKGTLYLHSTPLVFTNYFMRDSANLSYATDVFSHLPKGNIIWDSKNRYSSEFVENKNRQKNNFIRGSSPLQFIIKQPALRKAWFILLGLAIIYVAFTSKRLQRIIPVHNEPTNENLRILELLAARGWRKKEYSATAFELFQQFKNFVKKRYRIEFKERNLEFTANLSETSNIPQHIIEKIANTYFSALISPINERELAEMFQALRAFYSKSV